jgi:hypothetical protein
MLDDVQLATSGHKLNERGARMHGHPELIQDIH